MTDEQSYWRHVRSPLWTHGSTISRRAALRGAATVAGGLAATGLIGCGGRPSPQSSSSAGKGGTGSGASATRTALDPTKGKPGGLFRVQGQNYAGTLVLVATNNAETAKYAGFTHSGLLEFRNGTPGVSVYDISVQPDLAQAMPEQPDEQTYVYKLKDARFHNGRTVNSEDVKYSYERYAGWEGSAYKPQWVWLDHVETPDPKTAVVKTKNPFADGLTSMAARVDGFILAKEWEESPEAQHKLMGSGPWLFVDTTPPLSTRFKKNPDYFQKPYPYFDEVEILGTSDDAKRVADFLSHQLQATYGFNYNFRDQIRQSRKDAVEWPILYAAHTLTFRCDQPPFNDKRVRQALSMAIDRKKIRDATTEGEGEDDQVLSWVQQAWGFRKPSQLGAAAKYWNYDPQAAKQLLSAAGVSLPIQADFTHWDNTVIGTSFVDHATLTAAGWKDLGLAILHEITQNFAQSSTTTTVGNYDGLYLHPSALMNNPVFGTNLRAYFFSPPEGVKTPTLNTGHVNDPELSRLVDKQLTQLNADERKQTLRQIEDILAEQQYWIAYSTYNSFAYTDPSLRNEQIPKYWFSGSIQYAKYWWFDKA